MEYKQTIEWMFSRLPMFQRQGREALNRKLDNIIAFTNHIGAPDKKIKTVHVAGTNGKGSSSHMLASVLQEAGYKVGLYTSPHLKDFRERIKINGLMIPKEAVVEFISKYRSFLEEHCLSFFEMTVAMAFDYFAFEKVDFAVIEVGLGGRWDSTNIITPEVCLITNIGKDHQDILGETLRDIAVEKAGIIKMGIPVVVSEYQNQIADIFQKKASENNATLVFASQKIEDNLVLPSDLQGIYQSKNIKGVMAVVDLLREKGVNISTENLKDGLLNVTKNTGFQGRWYKIGEKPLTICDTAHNEPGVNEVIQQISLQKYRKLHLVLGFVRDKDVSSILEKFPKDAFYYFVSPSVPRGLPVEELQKKAEVLGRVGKIYTSVNQGVMAARASASLDDFIYIGGSTFVVAEIVD